MLGSGMNSAAVAWTILQRTHSEMALGKFAALQTIPAMLMLPFMGVIIDREDRRRLVMMLDLARAAVILVVTVLAFLGRVQVWQLYLMNTLVAAGFWMFWPTITALIQELTPAGAFVQSNTLLLAGVQGGWLIAGALVGFVYEHIGLGGVLLIDVSTYVVSFLCYFAVRQGRHVVPRAVELRHDLEAAETAVGRFLREMREGLVFLRAHRSVVFLGTSWALFLGAMMTGVVVTAPLSDRDRPLSARDARRAGLSARASQRGFSGYELGFVSGRDDDGSGGHGATQRSRLSRRRDRLRLVERGMGCGRIPERSLCSGADCAGGSAHCDCACHAAADIYDGPFTVFAVAGDCRAPVWTDGIGARRQRRGHEYQPDETSATAFHGTRPEHFLFLWHVSAGGTGADGGRRGIADQPGSRVWHNRRRVCGRIWQRLLADESTARSAFNRGVAAVCVERTLLSAAVNVDFEVDP